MQQEFSHRSPEEDQLFQADYDHLDSGKDCKSCDQEYLIQRKPRTSNVPVIHYGLIGSANQVMRHGVTREKLRQESGIICLEMEAAGLMDNFPCLVIRGICDYSDTHKNKNWQPYAAATAAAYAKELLGVIPSIQVDKTPIAADAIKVSLLPFPCISITWC
jgi:nucleoside phosphorylase